MKSTFILIAILLICTTFLSGCAGLFLTPLLFVEGNKTHESQCERVHR